MTPETLFLWVMAITGALIWLAAAVGVAIFVVSKVSFILKEWNSRRVRK